MSRSCFSQENATKSKRSTRAGVARSLTSTVTVDVPRPLSSMTAVTNQPSPCAGDGTSKSVANVNKTSSSCSRRVVQFWKVTMAYSATV